MIINNINAIAMEKSMQNLYLSVICNKLNKIAKVKKDKLSIYQESTITKFYYLTFYNFIITFYY